MNSRVRLIVAAAVVLCACNKANTGGSGTQMELQHDGVTIEPRIENWDSDPFNEVSDTKSSVTDEDILSDINILIFDAKGKFMPELSSYHSDISTARALVDPETDYTILMLANTGEDLIRKAAEEGTIENVRENLKIAIDSYAGSFKGRGMPMSGLVNVSHNEGKPIPVTLKRLYSKWIIDVDCSRATHSSFKVNSLKICNAPTAYYPFRTNSGICSSEESSFENGGDFASGGDLKLINNSGKVVMYVLENMQGGNLLPDNSRGSAGKTRQALQEAGYEDLYKYSYVEMGMEAHTPTADYGNAIYRAYLGEDMSGNFNICRNKTYYLTLQILDEDITGQEWRVSPGTPMANYAFTTDRAWAGIMKGRNGEFKISSTSKNLLELLTVSIIDKKDETLSYSLSECRQISSTMYQRILSVDTGLNITGQAGIDADMFSSSYKAKESRLKISYKNSTPSQEVSVYSFDRSLPLLFKVDNHKLYLGSVEHAPEIQYTLQVNGDVCWQHLEFIRSGLIRKDVFAEALTSRRPFSFTRTSRLVYDENNIQSAFYTGIDFTGTYNSSVNDLGAVNGYSDQPHISWNVDVKLDCPELDNGLFYVYNNLGYCDTPVLQTPYYIGWGDSDSYIGGDRGDAWYLSRRKVYAVPLYDTCMNIMYKRMMANFSTYVYLGDYLSFNGEKVL